MALPTKGPFTPTFTDLFLHATTTDRKWVLNSLILNANFKARLRVEPLRKHASHHSAIEDGTSRDANAALKHEDSGNAFDELRPGGPLHSEFAKRLVAEGMLLNTNHFDPQHIFHLSTDESVAVAIEVWGALKELLSEHVPAHLLEADTHTFNGRKFASVQEIGPLAGALGSQKLWELFDQAARLVKVNDDIIFTNQITALVTRMSAPKAAPAHKIEAEHPFHLVIPNKLLSKPLRLLTSEMFSYPQGSAVSMADDFPAYAVSNQNPIADVVRELVALANDTKVKRIYPGADFSAAGKKITAPKTPTKSLQLVQPSAGEIYLDGTPVSNLGGVEIKKRGIETAAMGDIERFVAACSMKFDFGRTKGGKPFFETADCIVIPPIDPKNYWQRLDAMTKLASADVAKQFDPAYLHVPVIVLNLNGCHDDLLTAFYHSSNNGFNKNFPMGVFAPDTVLKCEGVEHYPTYSFHELRGNDARAMLRAAKKLREGLMGGYLRHGEQHHDSTIMHGGTPMPEGLINIVPILSASNEVKPLNERVYNLGAYIAEQGFAMSWGASDHDTKPMGSIRNGYRDAHGIWHFAVSTHGIIKVESVAGRIPAGCDAWQLSHDISPRMLSLFLGRPALTGAHKQYNNGADILLGEDGGTGTLQEGGVFEALKHMLPDEMSNRFSLYMAPPDSPMEQFLMATLGREEFQRAQKDHAALAETHHILLSTSEEETRKRLSELREHINKQKAAPALIRQESLPGAALG